MKKFILIFLVFITTNLVAQAPQSFSYQAVVRDATGEIIANSPVSLRISIIAGSAQGQAVYTETHFTTTNQFGLVAVNVGQGTTTYGLFDTIPWGSNNYFIQTEMDVTGGANFVLMGTTQLLSVPYALYGRDEDYDTINEIQSLSYTNDTLALSKSNKIDLPTGFLGEVRMVAISLTGADNITYIKSKGWAICNGTTSASQGINGAIILETPDLSEKFIRCSNDTTSGNVGGSESHNHIWRQYGRTSIYTYNEDGTDTYNKGGSVDSPGNYQVGFNLGNSNNSISKDYTSISNHLPPYYELVYIIKVK